MKSEYGTGEVILLQTLDYFRKKVEALEGESYRADELDFCYNSLHEDYVKKCAEYTALEVSYNKLAEAAEDEIANLKEELNMVSKSNNEMLDKLTIARNQNYCDEQDIRRLKQALDERMTECDELKSEIRLLKNQISLSPEESEFLTHIAKIAEDEAKIANVVCGDLNKATTPISSEKADALTYMTGWEKAGY